MSKAQYQELLQAGVHFGHMRKKWNPKMRQYIFAERKGVHIIDLNRTIECIDHAGAAMKSVVPAPRLAISLVKRSLRQLETMAPPPTSLFQGAWLLS